MMSRAFKFRHANELAGGLTLLVLALTVVGVVMAGRTQGWFEGSFAVQVLFETKEGAYGLQEGAEVQVRNAPAGRVGRISPNEEGQLGAVLVIKERFRNFVHADSLANVKRKFGVAGDTYIEIKGGSGGPIEEGAQILSRKDEELTEQAEKLLRQVEDVVVPIMEETHALLMNVNALLTSVREQEGLVGAVLSNGGLRDDVVMAVSNAAAATAEVRSLVGELDSTVAGVKRIVTNDVATLTAQLEQTLSQVQALIADQGVAAADGVVAIEHEALRTTREVRRLVEGAQQHWLVRKHVSHDGDVTALDALLRTPPAAERGTLLQGELDEARARGDQARIAKRAAALAVIEGIPAARARRLLTEAQLAAEAADDQALLATVLLLSAEAALGEGRLEDAAVDVAGFAAMGRRGGLGWTKACASALEADLAWARGDGAMAATLSRKALKALPRKAPAAVTARVWRSAAQLREQDEQPREAAAAYLAEAAALRQAHDFGGAAVAQAAAGRTLGRAGEYASAARHWLAASDALRGCGRQKEAAAALLGARPPAEAAGDALLMRRVEQLESLYQLVPGGGQ